MTRTRKKIGPDGNHTASAVLSKALLAVVIPPASTPPYTAPPDHPNQNFDRAASAALARLSGGVSTHAFIDAWSDWVQHLARSPGRQMELAEHAQRDVLKLMAQAARPEGDPPFAPKPYDLRFDCSGWQNAAFSILAARLPRRSGLVGSRDRAVTRYAPR